MITVRRYRKTDESAWNVFVATSANATFILNRRYMEYHNKRFSDHSLIVYDDQKLIALFPANQKGKTIYSHGGLTYGGLIVAPEIKLITTLSCFYAITKYYHRKGFKTVVYKPVPSFLHTAPFYQDSYALFLLKSTCAALNTGFVADLTHKPALSSRRMRMVRKAQKYGITVVRAPDCKAFWKDILVPRLEKCFRTKPVHTAGEIELLRARFPLNIVQYVARSGGRIVAGATLFIDRRVVHTQYIASTALGRQTGSLDYLFWHLMTHEFADCRTFSLGTTNMGSSDGRALSRGLVQWKEGFDTHMVPYPCYAIKTNNYRLLKPYTV